MSEAVITIVRYSLLIFNILGTFGNLNIIYATAKHKRFHHNCGYLLGFLAICDLTCLWYELQSFIRMTFNLTESPRRSCFWANSGYIFMEVLEVYTIFALAVDRQLAISFPFSYRTWSSRNYLGVLILPGIMLGFGFLIASFFFLLDDVVDPCVLPFSMPPNVSQIWNYYNMGMAILTVIVYVFTYAKLYLFKGLRMDPSQKSTQKAILSTVIVQAIVFFCSSVLSAFLIMLIERISTDTDLIGDVNTLAVIPGLVSYTCNFYVYFWRSADYRDVFMKQIFCGRVLVKETTAVTQASTVSVARISARVA